MSESGGTPTASGERRDAVLAFAIPFLLLVAFSSKAFHIDDTHFLRMAQHIQEAPLDYFGYEIHWNGYVGRGYDTNYNPPGVAFLLALAGGIVGWNEVPLHILFAAIAGLTSLGIYRLAQRFTPCPLLATAVTALTPGFIVSSATLMSDTPALGLYVWGLHLWVSGIDTNRHARLIAAMLLIALCTLTKYFGVTALGLCAVYALVQRRALGSWGLYLLVPPAFLLVYSWHTHAVYGQSHFLFAREFAVTVHEYLDAPLIERLLIVVPYLGAMALPWALYLMIASPRSEARALTVAFGAALVMGAVAGGFEIVRDYYGVGPGAAIPYLALAAVSGLLAVIAIICAAKDVLAHRDAAAVVLALWLFGCIAYAVAVAPILGARVLLPALTPMGLLFARRLEAADNAHRYRYALAWAFTGLLAVSVLTADYIAAERDRQAALHAADIAESLNAPLFYYGTWGFQYYAEEAGAKPFFARQDAEGKRSYPLTPGSLIVIPQMYSPIEIPPSRGTIIDDFVFQELWPVATWDARSRAGYYGEFLGRLPFAFSGPRSHHFLIYRVHPEPAPNSR